MIRGVIFDLDNTLYDYDKCNDKAEKKLMTYIEQVFGIQPSEAYRRLYDAKSLIKAGLGETASSHNRLLYMQAFCEMINKNPMIYAKDMYDCYWDEFIGHMQLFNYVMPTFSWLKQHKVCIAILTDLTAHIQYRKIYKLGIADWIDVLVTSEEVGTEKPDRKAFSLVLKKMKIEASECLMVGDNQKKDIDGANNIGIEGIKFSKDINDMEARIILKYENGYSNTLL